MLRSMTGYGRAQGNGAGFDISVDIKSVNHRYFEFNAKIPKSCLFLEDSLKKLMQETIARGKIEVLLSIQSKEGSDTRIGIDEAAATSCLEALRAAGRKFGLEDDIRLSDLLRFPDIFTVEKAETDESALADAVMRIASEAAASYQEMRAAEGEKLREDLENRLETVSCLVGDVEKRAPELQKAYYSRLYQKLLETLDSSSIEESRIVTEAAIFADKVAVDEETVRLRSHLAQFASLLHSDGPVGKKLDFLVQEMNRETNTIGSKGQDVAIARTVVEMKSEIEKIREQIQNIE